MPLVLLAITYRWVCSLEINIARAVLGYDGAIMLAALGLVPLL